MSSHSPLGTDGDDYRTFAAIIMDAASAYQPSVVVATIEIYAAPEGSTCRAIAGLVIASDPAATKRDRLHVRVTGGLEQTLADVHAALARHTGTGVLQPIEGAETRSWVVHLGPDDLARWPERLQRARREDLADQLLSADEVPRVHDVSLAPMAAHWCVACTVVTGGLAGFLNDAGRATADAGFPDVQFWMHRRTQKKGGADEKYSGFTNDSDRPIADPVRESIDAGLPIPTVFFPTDTPGHHRLITAYDQNVGQDEQALFGAFAVLGLDGADANALRPTQGQHLPTCLNTTSGDLRRIEHEAVQVSARPFQISTWKPHLPNRLLKALGGAAPLACDEQMRVENFLDEAGLSPPEDPGTRSYTRCLGGTEHAYPSCTVVRDEESRLSVRCFGDHEAGAKTVWREHDLLAMSNGATPSETTLDPERDIPATWAGVSYVRFRAADQVGGKHSFLDATVRLWLAAKAEHEVESWKERMPAALAGCDAEPPTRDHFQRLYRRRIDGERDLGPVRLAYDPVQQQLGLWSDDERIVRPVRHGGATLSAKVNLHEFNATQARQLGHKKAEVTIDGKKYPVVKSVEELRFGAMSLANKALGGHRSALGALGVPVLDAPLFPVAFLEPSWTIDPVTTAISAVLPCPLPPSRKGFDAVEFFVALQRQGRLPLASVQDALRLVMAIAAPLLAPHLRGQSGLFWFLGPSGAGKDYAAELAPAIWMQVARGHPPAAFDLTVSNELELKRTVDAASRAPYLRAREAGKRAGMVDALIRLSGAQFLAARGMRKDEIAIPNNFTFLAESAEEIPDRKEVSRRTVTINVAAMDDKISKGEVVRLIQSHAGDILNSLKAAIESHPIDWYIHQTDTGMRPLIPAALAKLFGVELPIVRGKNTDELFEAMLVYIRDHGALEGAAEQQKSREKDGREAVLFPSYKVTSFRDAMRRIVGYEHLGDDYKRAAWLERELDREMGYARVKDKLIPYLPVEIGDVRYAFKLVRAKRNFVLVEEQQFCAVMGIQPLAGATAPPIVVPGTDAAPAPAPEHGSTFSDEDLIRFAKDGS